MGGAWKTENGWVWWETSREARERIQKEDEECRKRSNLIRRFQDGLHQENQRRWAWGRAN